MRRCILAIAAYLGLLISACENESLSTEAMIPKNLCEFTVEDYDNLRKYFRNLAKRNAENDTQTVISNFGFSKVDYSKIPDSLRFKMMQDKKLSFDQKFGQVSMSCPLENGNKNIWSFEMIVEPDDKISEADFYLAFEDENFLARNIQISSAHIIESATFEKALLAISEKYEGEWAKVRTELKNGNFHVSVITSQDFVSVSGNPKENGRIFYRLLGLPVGPHAVITVDESHQKIKSIKTL